MPRDGAAHPDGRSVPGRRPPNNAIQRANFDSRVTVAGETMSLSEALELRKAAKEQIGELSTQLGKA
jgi:hypothetical protein